MWIGSEARGNVALQKICMVCELNYMVLNHIIASNYMVQNHIIAGNYMVLN